jgi:hypothetical protein
MSVFKIPGLQIVTDNAVFRKHVTQTPGGSLALLAVLAYLGLESYYLFFRFNGHAQDLALYQGTAMKILDGQVPFRDFRLEYPLFSLIPIVIPGMLSKLAGGSFQSYVFWFVVQNLFLGLVTAIIIGKTDITGKVLPRYLMIMLFSFPIFLFRFDIFPALLTILSIAHVSRKPFLSGISLMASVAAKLYSITLVPVFGLFYLLSQNKKKWLFQLAGMTFIGAIILCTVAWTRMNAASDFMHYHLMRGIQIESVPGGILLLFDYLGLVEVDIAQSFGAMHLTTPVSATVLQSINIITPLCFAVMAIYVGWAFRKASVTAGVISFSQFIAAATAQILLFILLNKVFSPQYMVWLLPLVPFCRPRAFLLFTAALMLTILIFPGHYYNLVSKQLLMVIILNLRNAILIGLFFTLIPEIISAGKTQQN